MTDLYKDRPASFGSEKHEHAPPYNERANFTTNGRFDPEKYRQYMTEFENRAITTENDARCEMLRSYGVDGSTSETMR